ncbi:MAG: hypothetical protein LBE84_03480 [Planctomycetota bacterium]|nr:hypothetical protein [Planctomycetota bacterium]
MAKEGKKDLYEILAARKEKGGGKPLAADTRTIPSGVRQAPLPRREAPRPTVIVDDAVLPELSPEERDEDGIRESRDEMAPKKGGEKHSAGAGVPVGIEMESPPAPRRRTSREMVVPLNTAFLCFTIILALAGCAYFLGYKRGREERPAAPAADGVIGQADPGRINPMRLEPAPRSVIRPTDQDYTLIIRTEAADGELLERLVLELSEAIAKGELDGGGTIPGFIFKTGGTDPRYVLAVGIGKSVNDQALDRLLKIYYRMDGLTLSREPTPYRGCRVAPVRELGSQVY